MDRSKFYASLRARASGVFGTSLSQSQVTGIEELLDVAQAKGVKLPHLSYILGGVYHETGGMMVPVREGFAKTDAGARRIVAKRSYGKPAGPYGHVYYGRGRIQNTWLRNMETLSKRFGYDFVKNPDLLLDPAIDAIVTVVGHLEGLWTGKKLSDYISEGRTDYVNARRIVNGTDKAAMIAGYAKAFEKALREAGYVGQAPKKIPFDFNETTEHIIPDPKPSPVTPVRPDPIPNPKLPDIATDAGATKDTDVVLVDGPKKDETQVVIVTTPKPDPKAPAAPPSKTGIAALVAIVVALVTGALKYFGG